MEMILSDLKVIITSDLATVRLEFLLKIFLCEKICIYVQPCTARKSIFGSVHVMVQRIPIEELVSGANVRE
jgi:hypothetical protein